MAHLIQTAVLLVALRSHPTPLPTGLVATLHTALHGFNTQNCAQIYESTAPWVRSHQSRADTIAACQQAFTDGDQHGVTLLRLTVAGPGRYLSAGAYRQPLLLRRVLFGRMTTAHETMQVVRVGARWYVLALW